MTTDKAPATRRGASGRARGPSRFAQWRARVSDRLARSSRVFLLGLIIACGIEVLVDWNSTLFEINVLREGMRQRGINYVSILTQASVEPMLAYDADAMDTLSAGLFDDEDVVFVRFSDHLGITVYDRLAKNWGTGFSERRGKAFRDVYAAQMTRDVQGILSDPETLRGKMAKSRYRDFVQLWNDLVARVSAWFVTPTKPPQRTRGVVLYQDRLSNERKRHDGEVTYALGTIVDDRNDEWGVVLVGFSMDRTNAAIRTKLLKGLGMVLFFVGLILVQNTLSRRDKLRLLDLETRYGAAKKSIRDALPESLQVPGLSLGVALEQAVGCVDGMAWDAHCEGTVLELLVVDPDGDGVSAAATALHLLNVYRGRRRDGIQATLEEEAEALGAAALVIPLTRPVGLMLLRINSATGECEGLASPLGIPWIPTADSAALLETKPESATPAGVVGPVVRVQGSIPAQGCLVALCASRTKGPGARSAQEEALVDYVTRNRTEDLEAKELAADAATWARGKLTTLQARDLIVLVLLRVRH